MHCICTFRIRNYADFAFRLLYDADKQRFPVNGWPYAKWKLNIHVDHEISHSFSSSSYIYATIHVI